MPILLTLLLMADGRPSMWMEAIENVNLQKEFVKVIDKVLKDNATTPAYELLMMGAQLLGQTEPQRGIELLKQAWYQIPHSKDGKENHTQVAWFSDQMVTFLQAISKRLW